MRRRGRVSRCARSRSAARTPEAGGYRLVLSRAPRNWRRNRRAPAGPSGRARPRPRSRSAATRPLKPFSVLVSDPMVAMTLAPFAWMEIAPCGLDSESSKTGCLGGRRATSRWGIARLAASAATRKAGTPRRRPSPCPDAPRYLLNSADDEVAMVVRRFPRKERVAGLRARPDGTAPFDGRTSGIRRRAGRQGAKAWLPARLPRRQAERRQGAPHRLG